MCDESGEPKFGNRVRDEAAVQLLRDVDLLSDWARRKREDGRPMLRRHVPTPIGVDPPDISPVLWSPEPGMRATVTIENARAYAADPVGSAGGSRFRSMSFSRRTKVPGSSSWPPSASKAWSNRMWLQSANRVSLVSFCRLRTMG